MNRFEALLEAKRLKEEAEKAATISYGNVKIIPRVDGQGVILFARIDPFLYNNIECVTEQDAINIINALNTVFDLGYTSEIL